jgi:phospholipid/cholesterol/gamma-HCH transport system permease protein
MTTMAEVGSSIAVATSSRPWELHLSRAAEGTLVLRLAGSWRLEDKLPGASEVQRQLEAGPPVRRLTFDAGGVSAWDTGLLTFVRKVMDEGKRRGFEVDRGGLPQGAQRLMNLATAVAPKETGREAKRVPWLERVGAGAVAAWAGGMAMIVFVGQACLAFWALIRRRARFQSSDLWLIIEECGARALPIVTLICFLVGLILAFVGAVQLRRFGAQIYVADLVGIAMAQEMGAMMTGIILAGRTGAAFAAQLGTMQVNEEIDALRTMGIAPMEFLVLPRMLALILMTPLLTIYGDVMGILGGAFVGVTMLKLSLTAYMRETLSALVLKDFAMGLFKGAVFGVLVAWAGCLRGTQCGRSSAAVGLAATAAVVLGIVSIIVSDSILTVIYNALGL